jgi:PKD repeat protein
MQRRLRYFLLLLPLAALFLPTLPPPGSPASAKGGAETTAPPPPVRIETQVTAGLFRVVLDADAGRLFFNAPYAMAAGEAVSGTIIAEPSGRDSSEQARNRRRLNDYTFDFGGQKLTAERPTFQLTVPAPGEGGTATLVIRDGSGREVGRAGVPVSGEPPPPPPADFNLPAFGQSGDFVQIAGPFDGRLSPTDSVKLAGGGDLLTLAESSGEKVVYHSAPAGGLTTLEVNEGGRVVRGDFQSVGVEMSAPKLQLVTNEQTDLSVLVRGLAGLRAPLPLQVRNDSPDVMRMEGGEAQDFIITPADVQAGGTYTLRRRLTGIRVGPFSLRALLLRDCTFTIALHNLNEAGAYHQVRISARGSTRLTKVAAAPWVQQSLLPQAVLLRPSGTPPNTPIPAGTHLVTVSVAPNFAGGGQQLLVEWLDLNGRSHCRQILNVDCGVTLTLPPEPSGGARTPAPGQTPAAGFAPARPGATPPVTAAPAGGAPPGAIQPGPVSGACRETRAIVLERAAPLTQGLREMFDCDPSFVVSQKPGCNSYRFTNTTSYEGGVPPSYTWYVLGENENYIAHADGEHFDYTFQDPGTYSVVLAAEGMACGDMTETSERYEITIPPLRPDFNWRQKECDPRTLEFTNQSEGDGLTYQWNITGPNMTGQTYTVADPTHTFPGDGQYTVCLKATAPDGCERQECKTVEVSKACRPDFDWVYTACATTPPSPTTFKVSFTNLSTGGACPVTYKWDFGDNSPSTNQTGPEHTYTRGGEFTVRLTMKDSSNPACEVTKEHKINLAACSVEVGAEPCPDGDVAFEASGDDLWSYKWEFPGSAHRYRFLIPRKRRPRVRYDAPGPYTAFLTFRNNDKCECSVRESFVVPGPLQCCARNDKDKIRHRDFAYNGEQYRVHGKLLVRNLFGLHYVTAKTVLLRKVGGFYLRVKAKDGKIRVSWKGNVYKSSGECCCKAENPTAADSGELTNVRKAKRTHWIGEKFRARDHSITSTHFVQVDKNHTPEEFNLHLGEDCDRCKRP